MFESSLVDVANPLQVRRRLTSFPAAIALHGLVLCSVAIAQYWGVDTLAAPDAINVVWLSQTPPPPPAAAPSGGRPSAPVPARPDPAPVTPALAQPEDVPDEAPPPAPAAAATAGDDLLSEGDTGGHSVPGGVGTGGDSGSGVNPHGSRDGVEDSVAPADDEPIHFRAGITRPEILDRVDPRYPELDRRARSQGVVVVEAVIDEQGRVRNVTILRGLSRGLDQATIDAVSRWRFKPATLDGRPVKIYYSLTVNFKVQ